MVKVGLIGLGYWGPNLARVAMTHELATLTMVCDQDPRRWRDMSRKLPGVTFTQDAEQIFKNSRIDAILIATPAGTHYGLAKAALEANKHTFVEKPLALSSEECADLIELAESRQQILMVGHVFLYNAAVRKLREYIESGEVGKLYYLYSQRLSLGKIRNDVNALWNFAPHDVSIILYLLGENPSVVTAKGYSYIQESNEDVAFMTLDFPSGVAANVHISWLDPHKVRRMTLVGSKKMVVYDDTSAEAKLTVYDKGISRAEPTRYLGDFKSYGDFQLLLRSGDIFIPKINLTEPLEMEFAHFIECINSNSRPLSDGENGLLVVKVLEAASKSLKGGGVPVKVE